MASAQQMQMQMMDRLPCRIAGVDDQPIPLAYGAEARFLGKLGRDCHQLSDQWRIIPREVEGRGDMPPRNQEQMRRGLRRDVAESHDRLILIEDVRRNLPGGDATEQAR